MTTEQFKFRTSQLQLPRDIIELYDKTVKSCIVCEKSKPVPQRSRVSGMRNEVFGDMIFLDYGDFEVGGKMCKFLLILDAATTMIMAYPVVSDGADEGLECMDDNSILTIQ